MKKFSESSPLSFEGFKSLPLDEKHIFLMDYLSRSDVPSEVIAGIYEDVLNDFYEVKYGDRGRLIQKICRNPNTPPNTPPQVKERIQAELDEDD